MNDPRTMKMLQQMMDKRQQDPTSVVRKSDMGENFKVESPDQEYLQQMMDKRQQDPRSVIRESDLEVTPDTISDPSSSLEMKKRAMNMVKKKYLGQ